MTTTHDVRGLVDLVLTDDEIAATAVHMRTHWRGPLPTVDQIAAGELENAVWRGARSLRARQTSGESPERIFDLLTIPLTQPVVLRTFVAKGDLTPIGGTLLSCIYGDAGGYVVEIVQPDGLHQFAQLDLTQLRELVEAGFAHDDITVADSSFCAVITRGDAVIVYTSGPPVMQHEVDPSSGRILRSSPGAVGDVVSAVRERPLPRAQS